MKKVFLLIYSEEYNDENVLDVFGSEKGANKRKKIYEDRDQASGDALYGVYTVREMDVFKQ